VSVVCIQFQPTDYSKSLKLEMSLKFSLWESLWYMLMGRMTKL